MLTVVSCSQYQNILIGKLVTDDGKVNVWINVLLKTPSPSVVIPSGKRMDVH